MSSLNAFHTIPAKLAPTSGFWARGKSLVTFYKTGISNVWENRLLAREIRKKYNCTNSLTLAKAIVENRHLSTIEQKITGKENAQSVKVSRSELLTLFRTEKDLFKLPMFVVIFAICFEMTPIVLWVLPRIAPSTCWSVKFNKNLQETYQVNLTSLKNMTQQLNGSESAVALDDRILRQLARTLDFGHRYRFTPRNILVSRINDHLTFVRADDAILRQNLNKLDDLDSEELTRALMSRCLPISGGLCELKSWLENFKHPMDAGFMCSK